MTIIIISVCQSRHK